MLPQNHLAVAAVATLVVAYAIGPWGDWSQLACWVVIAGAVAAAIDMDVILITRRAARTDPELVPFADPLVATRDLKAFLVLLYRKGLLAKVRWTHLASGIAVTTLAYLLVPPLTVPVAVGAWTHLATDVPYLSSISRAAREGNS